MEDEDFSGFSSDELSSAEPDVKIMKVEEAGETTMKWRCDMNVVLILLRTCVQY